MRAFLCGGYGEMPGLGRHAASSLDRGSRNGNGAAQALHHVVLAPA